MNWQNCSSKLIIFLTGVGMIWFGVEHDELKFIFAKATRVCLECIGLG